MQRYSLFTITIIVISLLFGQVRFVMTETLVSTQPCTMENMSYEHLTHDALLTDSDAKDIATSDLYFIDKVGLKEHLSPTRSNGLVSMVKQMKMYGIAFQAKS